MVVVSPFKEIAAQDSLVLEEIYSGLRYVLLKRYIDNFKILMFYLHNNEKILHSDAFKYF